MPAARAHSCSARMLRKACCAAASCSLSRISWAASSETEIGAMLLSPEVDRCASLQPGARDIGRRCAAGPWLPKRGLTRSLPLWLFTELPEPRWSTRRLSASTCASEVPPAPPAPPVLHTPLTPPEATGTEAMFEHEPATMAERELQELPPGSSSGSSSGSCTRAREGGGRRFERVACCGETSWPAPTSRASGSPSATAGVDVAASSISCGRSRRCTTPDCLPR
mmetsp:Transcript_26747/g.68039  ORF Transcript_26747/g.68039 Transcript_26747/m.68039 type:complete len:224 (+) Transcript_26747:341-1012(+)